MIKINGIEYNLFYSVSCHIAFDQWVIKNPKATYVEGIIRKFTYMVAAYNDANDIKAPTPKMEEFMNLPNAVFLRIAEAVQEQEKADSEVLVETDPVEPKNA